MATPPSFTAGQVLNAAQMNKVGLWLVKTQTIGSGVSSQAVTGAFSADYDNYLITVSGGTGSASGSLKLQLGAAVTNYAYTFSYSSYASTPLAVGTSTDTSFVYAGSMTATSLGMQCFVQNPYLAEHTFVQSGLANATFAGSMAGVKSDTTQYTDFTLITSTGTMTGGTIRVYGYNNG